MTTSIHQVEGSRVKGRAGELGTASQSRRKEDRMSHAAERVEKGDSTENWVTSELRPRAQ